MKYDTNGVEKLEQTDTAKSALMAVTQLSKSLTGVGPDTKAFALIMSAKAEAENWLRYLNLGGFQVLGRYEPLT